MIFQLGIAGSTSIHENNYHKVFLSRSIEELQFCLEYQHFLTLQLYSHYKEFHVLSRRIIILKKGLLYFFKFIDIMFWDSCFKRLESNF